MTDPSLGVTPCPADPLLRRRCTRRHSWGEIGLDTGHFCTYSNNMTITDGYEALSAVSSTIHERGNGFPDVGDFVAGNDGEVYRVVALDSRIHTSTPGANNYIYGTVEMADWADVTDRTEPKCSAVIGGIT